MDTQRCLDILGLKAVTSPEELKQAYRDMVQIWHPDRFNNNPRLEQIAQEKLREINIAYKQLLAYFDPNQSKLSRTPIADRQIGPQRRGKKHGRSMQRVAPPVSSFRSADHANSGQSGQFTSLKIYAAPKRSFFRKWGLRAFFCILLGLIGLTVYLSFYMDNIVVKSKALVSEAVDQMATKLEENEAIQKKAPTVKQIVQDFRKETKSKEPKSYFYIYLDSGSVIKTEAWWEDNNMIMYKKHGGSLGIEKNRVKKIVKR